MKKDYISPETEIVLLEIHPLLENSLEREWSDGGENGGSIGDDDGQETGGPSAKSINLWDE